MFTQFFVGSQVCFIYWAHYYMHFAYLSAGSLASLIFGYVCLLFFLALYILIDSFTNEFPLTVSVTSNFPCARNSGCLCALPWHLGNGYVSCHCRRVYRADRAHNILKNLATTKTTIVTYNHTRALARKQTICTYKHHKWMERSAVWQCSHFSVRCAFVLC